jgi:ribonucleoside-diphosphate reductase alpha chain
VATAIRMMDNVVDASRFPLEAQAREAHAKRRIGLGVTGLADALAMVGLRYGSPEAAERTGRMDGGDRQRGLSRLGPDRGGERGLPALRRGGIRQGAHGEAARPGGAGADRRARAPERAPDLHRAHRDDQPLCGQCLLGDRADLRLSYTRKVLQPDGTRTEEEVVDYAVQMWRDMKGDADLPDHFVTAQDLAPLEHVRMQAAAQPWVDSSISKTINVPADIGFEAFKDVYLEAYETGCKGCTTYRPNEVTGSVLSVKRRDASKMRPPGPFIFPQIRRGRRRRRRGQSPLQTRATDSDVIYMSEPLDRPGSLEGHTYKLKWPDSDHAIYITINDIMLHGHRRPFEIFINSKNMEHFAWTVALTRMISAVFRRGGDVSFVVEELKAVFDPRGGAWMNGKYVPSILAAIGGVIERHLISIGFIDGEGMGLKTDPQAEVVNLGRPAGPACPSCGQYDMRMIEGCLTCANCGHSKCG